MYEKLISHKLSSFCKKCGLLPGAQFAYRKDVGCTDALLTISDYLQKFLGAAMESYIAQLNFSAAFDRVTHSGLLFKLKSIGVWHNFLPICTEFLCDCRQKVVVDGAASEWIPIISGMPQGSVLAPLLFILHIYQRNIWAGWEQPICLCRWLHTTSSHSLSRQTCCCWLP